MNGRAAGFFRRKKGGEAMSTKKALLFAILSAALILASMAAALDYKYVASKRSDKYHYPHCEWAKKIKAENMVTFRTAKEARAAGYVPCKVCNPPSED